MNRSIAILGIMTAGFALGFGGFMIVPAIPAIILFILSSPESVRAILAGMMGSVLATSTLIIWERRSR